MTVIEKIIYNRTRGSYGLSIATAHAMESLFGVDNLVYDKDRQFEHVSLSEYKYYYLNVHTIVRNIISSIKSTDKRVVLDNALLIVKTIIEEINIIKSLFSNQNCEVVLFYSNYFKVTYKRFLSPKNEIERCMQATITIMTRRSEEIVEATGVSYSDDFLIKTESSVLITTHLPVDLLNYKLNKKFDLLESTTGLKINKLHFNKKYPKSVYYDNSKLPFNEYLLRILGDNRVLEKPFKDLRKEVGEVADKKKWIPTTSERRVKEDLWNDGKTRDALNEAVSRLIYK